MGLDMGNGFKENPLKLPKSSRFMVSFEVPLALSKVAASSGVAGGR